MTTYLGPEITVMLKDQESAAQVIVAVIEERRTNENIHRIINNSSSIFLFVNNVYAELFSVSVGVPISHTISDDTVAESDGVSGTFMHAKLPLIPVGLGLESYKTNVKNNSSIKISTTMFDIFYLMPIPIINLTLGS